MPQEGGAGIQELISALIVPLAFIVIMYLMIILPQRKREKSTQKCLRHLRPVIILLQRRYYRKIINIKDDEITIETSVERTQIKIIRSAISRVVDSEES